MARTKGSEPRQHVTPTRIQDGTGLEAKIITTIIDEFIAPLEVRVEILEGQLNELLSGLAAGRFTIATATVPLKPGRRGGTSYVEPDDGFDEDAIGRPVLIVQGTHGDGDEFGVVQFTGEIISRQKMRVHWHAEHRAPREVGVVYIIG